MDDLLAHIEDKLPGIMKGAGVTTLVSKWDEKGMTKYAGAEQINVTMTLADALDPIEGQREFGKELQGRDPVK